MASTPAPNTPTRTDLTGRTTVAGWQDAGQDAYIYFDNDTKTRAPIDAMSMLARLRGFDTP